MARRGEELREHILWSAKAVFLEQGFERASMDEIAAQAETSKRSLYAHFRSKENLFLQTVDLVRERFLEHLGTPADYADEPVEALAQFLARAWGHVLWDSVVRTCRLAISEAERLPEVSRGYHEVIFEAPVQRMASFIASPAVGLADEDARRVAGELFTLTLAPSLLAMLFAVRPTLPEQAQPGSVPVEVDVAALRGMVADRLAAEVGASR